MLNLNGRWYEKNELLHLGFTGKDRGFYTDFEKATLQFCHEWLKGIPKFEQRTSGSTGKPKKIVLDRQWMLASARASIEFFNLKSGGALFVPIHTAYIGGKMMLVRAMEAGMNVIAVEPSSTALLELQQAVEMAAVVPMQLEAMLKSYQLPPCKTLIVGGSSISEAILDKCSEITTISIYHTYGMTETCSHIALRKISGPNPDSGFKTLPGVKLGIAEDHALWISGPMVYGGHIQTRDMVELKDDQHFTFLKRLDDIINSGGLKIDPVPIEALIRQHFPKLSFFLTKEPHEQLGEQLVMVLANPGIDFSEKALKNVIIQQYSNYYVPKHIYFTDSFVWSTSGKVLKEPSLNKAKQNSI